MSLELPGWLTPVCLFLGPLFPDGKEDDVLSMGDSHEQHGARMKTHLGEAQSHEQRIVTASRSDGVTAMHTDFSRPEGPHNNLVDAGTGSHVIGLGLKTAGGVILAHKGITLLQYGLTAAALVEALAAPGVGAALTPLIRQAGRRALDQTTNAAVNAILA